MTHFNQPDFLEEFLDHNRGKPNPIEIEPTPETRSEKQPKFSWIAFIVMLFSIGVALLVGTLIPGLFDEILAAIVISAVNAFISAHRRK